MVDAGQFGRGLRARREAAGHTVSELARRAGMAHQSVSAIELGQHQPTVTTLRRLATALGCDPAELLSPPAGHRRPTTTRRGRPKKPA